MADQPMPPDDVVRLLRDLGAGEIAHPGGNLLDHLRRTSDQLASWGEPDALVRAGLGHAAYGTAGFPVVLFDRTDPDQRRRVVDALGADAEAIVHTYCACDRDVTYPRLGASPLVLADRFAGGDVELTADEAHAFAALTIANELDIVRQGALDPATVAAVADLFRAARPHAPEEAAAALAELDEGA